jgi:hypothetical protein
MCTGPEDWKGTKQKVRGVAGTHVRDPGRVAEDEEFPPWSNQGGVAWVTATNWSG